MHASILFAPLAVVTACASPAASEPVDAFLREMHIAVMGPGPIEIARRQVVSDALAAGRGALLACYRDRASASPARAVGAIGFALAIDASGAVRVEISYDTLDDHAAQWCVRDLAASLVLEQAALPAYLVGFEWVFRVARPIDGPRWPVRVNDLELVFGMRERDVRQQIGPALQEVSPSPDRTHGPRPEARVIGAHAPGQGLSLTFVRDRLHAFEIQEARLEPSTPPYAPTFLFVGLRPEAGDGASFLRRGCARRALDARVDLLRCSDLYTGALDHSRARTALIDEAQGWPDP